MNHKFDKSIKIQNPIFTSFTVLPFNFYHFMTDFIFPFLAAKEENRQLFLPYHPTTSQIDILDFLQIDYIHAKFQANHTFSDAKVLPSVFVERDLDFKWHSNPGSNYEFNRGLLQLARKAILGNLPVLPIRQSKKIFISRRGATRSPQEIFQIEEVFRIHGFKIYNAEEYDLEETINLFQVSDFLVGFHGAGLTNMIFAEPKCRVVELYPISHKMGGDIRPIFKLLAEALDFNYEKFEIPRTIENWESFVPKLG